MRKSLFKMRHTNNQRFIVPSDRRQKTMTDMFELTLAVAGGLFVRTMSIRTLILEEENTRRTKNRLSNTAFPFSVLFSFFFATATSL